MKTKISVVTAMVLVIATTVTALTSNSFGSVEPTVFPVQGDPVPRVDVSIEQSPGGIIIGQTQTDDSGNWRVNNVRPGTYLLTGNIFTLAAAKFRSGSNQNATFLIKVGPKVILKTWDFSGSGSGRCLYTEKIVVPQGPPQSIEVTVLEGKLCEATSSPR